MITTLNKIRAHIPPRPGWTKLLGALGKIGVDDEPIDLMTILESNGIKDAIWCLRCFDYRDYCLFLADAAESVLPIYEKNNPDSLEPRKYIEAIRQYHTGDININQLKVAAKTAATIAYDDHAAYTAAAAYAAITDYPDNAVTFIVADAADAADDTKSAKKQKWQEIEKLFVKHFG